MNIPYNDHLRAEIAKHSELLREQARQHPGKILQVALHMSAESLSEAPHYDLEVSVFEDYQRDWLLSALPTHHPFKATLATAFQAAPQTNSAVLVYLLVCPHGNIKGLGIASMCLNDHEDSLINSRGSREKN